MEQPPPQQPPSCEDALDSIDVTHHSSFSLLRRCSLSLSSPHEPPRCGGIPGPAGAIQAAMHRKERHAPPHARFSGDVGDASEELVEISTQEYIRRVSEDSGEEFSRDPWIFAVASLRRDGAFNATSLKDVKKCSNAERIDQVVAVVKSCTPNGLGDMIVTLKDPTDTVGASVHRKVLAAEGFGKSITAGSVLILQKVVVFPSLYASSYLNITRRNVVKVISVDCEVQCFRDTNLDDSQVLSRRAEIPENTSALLSNSRRLSEDDHQLRCNVNDNTATQNSMEWEASTQATSLSSGKHIESSASKISKAHVVEDRVDSGHKASGTSSKWRDNSGRVAGIVEDQARDGDSDAWQQSGPELERLLRGKNCTTSMAGKRRNILHELNKCTPNDVQKNGPQMDNSSGPSLVDNLVNQGTARQNDAESTRSGFKKQRLGLISRTSVQEWTDEQLCVLEMDDD